MPLTTCRSVRCSWWWKGNFLISIILFFWNKNHLAYYPFFISSSYFPKSNFQLPRLVEVKWLRCENGFDIHTFTVTSCTLHTSCRLQTQFCFIQLQINAPSGGAYCYTFVVFLHFCCLKLLLCCFENCCFPSFFYILSHFDDVKRNVKFYNYERSISIYLITSDFFCTKDTNVKYIRKFFVASWGLRLITLSSHNPGH